eukprot:TRINITY_DN10636_c0_g1_i1.p1 TRINITY_DN10636_c0_g1~~TRINITY_DN10636_c0_g1_i1.p1  ORF type:complete len:241 (+),score=64.63 TRINITY_DN10636_c0_g1_i1:143-865(+)
MKIIGLTGGIAAGKSTVSNHLKKLGIPIIDADQIYHDLIQPGNKTYFKLIKHFGKENDILESDYEKKKYNYAPIDRNKLREIVFNDINQKKLLNKITHGDVGIEMFKQIVINFLLGKRAVVLDVPLLIEAKMDKYCSKIIVVDVSPEIQLERLLNRNPDFSEEEAKKIIKSQLSREERNKKATHLIDNNNSIEETQKQVEETCDSILPSPLAYKCKFILSVGLSFTILASIGYYMLKFLI